MKLASSLAPVRPLSALATVMGLILVTTSSALGGQETFKLLPNNGAPGDLFGFSVSISDNTVIAGAWGHDAIGNASGSAYLFDKTTGQQGAELLPSDGEGGDYFGRSVGISGGTAIVGAIQDDDNGLSSGSAYLFDVTTGQQLAKLLPSDGAVGDWFGRSVAISGNTAIVGSHLDDDHGFNSGSAYLFDVTTGQQIAKLLPSDRAAEDNFGFSVAISGSVAIVGARWADDNGPSSGSAYLFDVATGLQIAKLLPIDGAAYDNFGFSVAISGYTAVVGAYRDEDNGSYSGSAYLFDVTTGQQIAKLLPSDGAVEDYFGFSVAISVGTVIVGAPNDDDSSSDSGSVYLFDAITGQQGAKLLPSDGAFSDAFGVSVAMSGSTVLAGASGDDDNGSYSGSAYLFNFPPVGVNYCTPAFTNSTGQPGHVTAFGSSSASDNDVTLRAEQLPPSQFGYFTAGQNQAMIPMFGGSQGVLCIGQPQARLLLSTQYSGTSGTLQYQVDLANIPLSPPVAVQAGQTWNFQCWYRDNNPGPTSNFTDAVSITFM